MNEMSQSRSGRRSGVPRLLVAVGLLAAGLLGGAVGAGAQVDLEQRSLSFAQMQWEFSGSADYEITYNVMCECDEAAVGVTVVVAAESVVSASRADGATVINPRTVAGMLDEIQVELDRPAAVLAADFDFDIGHPLNYSFDVSDEVAGDERNIVVTNYTSNKFQALQQRLDAAQATWASLAPANENYDLTYATDCQCDFVADGEVEVRGGEVITASGPARTVGDLFDLVQEVIDIERPGLVRVEFDSATGVPMTISLDVSLFDSDFVIYQVEQFAFVEPCCDPQPILDVATSCLAGNGRVDVAVVSTTLVEGPVEHAIHIGALAPRVHTVATGELIMEVATGRRDGPLNVDLRIDGVVYAATTVMVDCDPDLPEVSVTVSCLAENGRFDVFLTLPPEFAASTYQVELAATGRPSIERSADVAAAATERVTITGRRDGTYTVIVTEDDSPVFSDQYTVDCDPPAGPVELTESCLGPDGRFDVVVFNDGIVPSVFSVSVQPLAVRTRTVQPAERMRISYTGRPDVPTLIEVVRDGGEVVFNATVTPNCDPD